MDERCWTIYRSVDVRFGRKVHDLIGPILFKYSLQFDSIADVDLLEVVSGVGTNAVQGLRVARIS